MTDKKIIPNTAASPDDDEVKLSIVQANSNVVSNLYRVVRFRGRPLLEKNTPYKHFVPLHKDEFDRLAYPLLGGLSRSRMGDVFAFLSNTAEDLTDNDHLILFGDMELTAEGTYQEYPAKLWNTRTLEWEDAPTDEEMGQAIWRSPYGPIIADDTPVEFVMSLAGGDPGVYDDIMQSLAPLIMEQKPDGVMWWVGDGANGKSTLMDAIYKIFPGQLSSITVKRLSDGRDTPSLNGTLANIVKESSEGRVEDTEVYKSIGTHEDFRVHKFHSQEDVMIKGNVHHIFSANTIPSFNDKGFSARRRTFIIPFNETFDSDPMFEKKTFTPEMFGRLVAEMAEYAKRLRAQGYRYKWSAVTLSAKADYDTDANNAEEYAKELIADGVVAFDSYQPVKMDYENYCAKHGFVPLGISNLRRALTNVGFDRVSYKMNSGSIGKRYRLPVGETADLVALGLQRLGMYTIAGFERVEHEPEIEEEEPPAKPEPKQASILEKW